MHTPINFKEVRDLLEKLTLYYFLWLMKGLKHLTHMVPKNEEAASVGSVQEYRVALRDREAAHR